MQDYNKLKTINAQLHNNLIEFRNFTGLSITYKYREAYFDKDMDNYSVFVDNCQIYSANSIEDLSKFIRTLISFTCLLKEKGFKQTKALI